MVFVLASNNKGKVREMNDILSQHGHRIISMAEAGIDSQPEENGETFEQNALIKARAAMAASGMAAVADDSGLEVEALNGAPGVYSARYCEGTDLDRVNLLLKNMEGCCDRRARFVSAIAMACPDGRELVVRGECPGEILTELRGDGGFGYDPVFYVPQLGCTFAQASPEQKNAVSHRGRAIALFCEKLNKITE